MSAMPGNPHAETLDADYIMTPDTRATLAVAHELRTANLIAAHAHMSDDAAEYLWVDHITPRLGLGGGDDRG